MKEDELAFARNMLPVKRPPFARGRYHRWPKDGVYRVVSHPRNGGKPFVAGFVVKGGKVVQCAPIIRQKIHYWLNKAEFVCEV